MSSFQICGKVRILLVSLGIICLTQGLWAYEFAGGTGEPNDPYQIATAEHLYSIGSDPNLLSRHYVLVNDIDLIGRIYDRALLAPVRGMAFTGRFDGQGHVICGLTIMGIGYLGLFGSLSRSGAVLNLGLENVNITGTSLYGYIGGLVGYNSGTVSNSYSRASVTGTCFSIGGLAGFNGGSVSNCFSTGLDVGGLVGFKRGSVSNSFWDIERSGIDTSPVGTGLTTARMQTAATFLNAAWDFVNETANGKEDIWTLCEGKDYPRLKWEQIECQK